MLRKPHVLLPVLLAVAALVILALPDQTRSRVRIAVSSLFLPLFGLAGTAQATSERLGVQAASRSTLAQRVQTLEAENRTLRLQIAEAQPVLRENERLRQMLGYLPRASGRLVPARVIGRDPGNWWQSVHINLGTRSGISTNLPVLTAEGLVGRVAEAGPWTSRVVLVGDPNCPVAAALADTGEVGIIRGASGGDIQGALVDLTYLSRNAVVRPGQRVITSGQGGVFPPGIFVGEVVDARSVGAGVFLEARVRLGVNLGTLDYLWVRLP